MGTVIPRSAAPERIIGDFDTTLSIARSREDLVKNAAEARLGPIEAVIDSVEGSSDAAEKAALAVDSKLTAADHDSDNTVGAVLDEIWNALGRPAQSVEYNLIAGTGKAQWTDGDPLEQAPLMLVLVLNIRRTESKALQARKEEWAARIEGKAGVQQAAADEAKKANAVVLGLAGQRRGMANLAQVALARLKRDYKNLGLTEPQIHQIIPDYVPKPRGKPVPPPAPPAPPVPTP